MQAPAVATAPIGVIVVPKASTSLTWSWTNEPALRVRYVRIRDNRAAPTGTGQIPSVADADLTVRRAFDLLPSPPNDIGAAWRDPWVTTQAFNTNSGLGALLADLTDEHECSAWEWAWAWTGATECPDDDHARWIGLTLPFNRGLSPTPGTTLMAAAYQASAGQTAIPRITPAHELAHSLGFDHVNLTCGGASVGGPFYAHPNNGSVLDVPFDPFWNQAIGGTVQDFMSYGCTVWPSADSWNRLQAAI